MALDVYAGGTLLTIATRPEEVKLDYVLAGGQTFRWNKTTTGHWIGVIQENVWRLKQTDVSIECEILPLPSPEKDEEIIQSLLDAGQLKKKSMENNPHKATIARKTLYSSIFRKYFGLNDSLVDCYKKWSRLDERFKTVAASYPGIRVLNQDFIENLFSFLCSSNNNVTRIQQMVGKMCSKFGRPLCVLDGMVYSCFPEVSKLAEESSEVELRKLGFGYRAAFVQKSAQFILQNSEWMDQVQKADYPTAKSLLMQLPGIGAKVADCICLMSLGHSGAVPVDTHVFALTSEHYMPALRGMKSVTPAVYDTIGDFYRKKFGDKAGWAHSVLFTAHLAKFRNKVESVPEYSTSEKSDKKIIKPAPKTAEPQAKKKKPTVPTPTAPLVK
ncbi:hypothetical protein RvY_01148 [Ramazzottius varieornatus]|uniref:N-glycosylase/DNA lyase n=1 Tax=Ramazzottius varieornatus TaxID=947166 RepID=A0A1D1UG70_RAMVA|nr:hypothetical protein RvY_01148 [Ramazzottius varieornatus]